MTQSNRQDRSNLQQGNSVMSVIRDPEVQMLASIAASLKADYVTDPETDPWHGSPFAWIKTRPSRQVGRIGEQLVAGWCAAKGLNVERSPDADADRIIEGKRTEIKFSTLWENGTFTFQQFRDQNYDQVICLGLAPFDAWCWVVPKEAMWTHAIPQHGGRDGVDTRWLTINPNDAPVWLRKYGGHLSEAFRVLSSGV